MNRKVIEVIVMVVAVIVWFILNHKPGATKYAGAIVIIGVVRVVGKLMEPKQPNAGTDDSAL
jgi:drug/metabolite transporter (DMT)-like permease